MEFEGKDWNLYGYVNENPTIHLDHSGKFCVKHCPPSEHVVYNVPPGEACDVYSAGKCSCDKSNYFLTIICNNAGSSCWGNCVRGCLLADWNADKCQYNSGLFASHAGCFNECDLECHGGVIYCPTSCDACICP